MTRIKETFATLAKNQRKGLITYLTAGAPDLEITREMLLEMARSGADLIEIGIPFSDPMADGPVIQAASNQALAGGVKVGGILQMVKEVRKEIDLPLVLMTYYNPVLQYGLEKFCQHAAESGIDGIIVPDLPYEESEPLLQCIERCGLDYIPLIAPTSTAERIEAICKRAQGFIYCVSVTGITGGQGKIKTDLQGFCNQVRKYTSLPLAVGFGISKPEMAKEIVPYCDAVVVGSALVRLVVEGTYSEVGRLTADFKQAIG